MNPALPLVYLAGRSPSPPGVPPSPFADAFAAAVFLLALFCAVTR